MKATKKPTAKSSTRWRANIEFGDEDYLTVFDDGTIEFGCVGHPNFSIDLTIELLEEILIKAKKAREQMPK